jgi:hypothetical protein
VQEITRTEKTDVFDLKLEVLVHFYQKDQSEEQISEKKMK